MLGQYFFQPEYCSVKFMNIRMLVWDDILIRMSSLFPAKILMVLDEFINIIE